MLFRVQPSDRYEAPRAAYAAAKRPLTVPAGRSVNPRLTQDHPTDPVKGLGRRKIPTSSQHPTRITNVPIAYSRLSAPRSLEQRALHNGDVVFAGKNETAFGAGTNRFSRCATLDDVNGLLSLDSNLLMDTDVEQAPKLLDSRSRITADLRACALQLLDDERSMRRAKQQVSEDMKESSTCLLVATTIAEQALAEAGDAVGTTQATPVRPEFDWMCLPALQNWKLDGILLGQEVDDTILNSMLPTPEDGDRLLNVCVEGPCPLRNQMSAVPQFFDDGVEPGGFLYVCLVAYSEHDAEWWRFALKPVSSRQLNCLQVTRPLDHSAPARPGGSSSRFTVGDLINTVAAWRLGRVVDDRLSVGQHGRVLLDVDIVLMDRLAFLRHHFGADDDPDLRALVVQGVVRRLPTSNTPPPPPQAGGEEAGGEEAGGEEAGGEEAGGEEAGEAARVVLPQQLAALERRPVLDLPMLFLPPPGQNQFVSSNRSAAPYEELAFNFGRAARVAGTRGWFDKAFDQQVYPLTPSWLALPHHRFSDTNNGDVVVATQTYTLRTLAARPQAYQSQWICNAVYLTEAGLPKAIDQFMLSAGPSIVDYNDICWLFSLMRDNGLTHTLCNALKRAKLGGQSLFPWEIKTSRVNDNARVGMISFKLPPVENGRLRLDGLLDMGQFVTMAPGKSFKQKARRVSFSLNLLFDLPMNTEWALSDTGSWNRSVADEDIWSLGSNARLGYLTDLSQNALTTGNDFQSTNFLTQLICFGILNATAMSMKTFSATRAEATNMDVTVQSGSGVVSGLQDSVYGSGILRSLAGTRWTPAVADDPYALAPANFPGSASLVPVPQRSLDVPDTNKQYLDALAKQRPDLFVFAAGGNNTVGDAVAAGMWSFSRMVYDGVISTGKKTGNLMWDLARLRGQAAQYDPWFHSVSG